MLLLSRRSILGVAGAALVASGRAMAAPPPRQALFRIQRSKNANVVQYDAVPTAVDRLDPRGPVIAYWIMRAEDGRLEGLNALDRRAYGFTTRAESSTSWLLTLNALRTRSIRVFRWRERWVAQTLIGGKNAVLERAFVASDESGLIPSVRWIDLFGVELASGARVSERLRP